MKYKSEIIEYIKKYNETTKTEFIIKDVDSQSILGKDFRLGIDQYKDGAICIMAMINSEVLAETTIYCVKNEMFNKIWFWKKEGRCLKKIFLSEMNTEKYEICIIFAYTEIANKIRKCPSLSYRVELLEFYVKLCKYIINELDVFCYLEPTGILNINESRRELNSTELDDEEIENLGKVYEESVVAEKVAKKIGMFEYKDIYHYITGGKIFFSKNLLD